MSRTGGRPAKPPGEARTERVFVACTLAERRAIEARAEAQGVTVSQYVREAALRGEETDR